MNNISLLPPSSCRFYKFSLHHSDLLYLSDSGRRRRTLVVQLELLERTPASRDWSTARTFFPNTSFLFFSSLLFSFPFYISTFHIMDESYRPLRPASEKPPKDEQAWGREPKATKRRIIATRVACNACRIRKSAVRQGICRARSF